MKAAYVEGPGELSTIKLGELPEPVPGPGEVRVAMRAAGLGPWDAKAIQGRFGELANPYIIGFEFAGVVDQLGEGVSDVAVGDEVFGTDWKAGSCAELRVAARGTFANKPSKFTFEEAAALVVGGTTALEGLVEKLAVGPGDTVLITGASGGVGTIAVQIAHDAGARVIGLSSATNMDYLRALGADVVLDYDDKDWPDEVRRDYPDGVDKVFDAAGGETLARAFEVLKPGGHAVGIVYGMEAPEGVRFERFSAGSGTERLDQLARMADEGRLRVELEAQLPLDQVREALERVAAGHTRGKVVLTV
ncbi:MAG: hypothetical protein QOK05_1708 [Chloroflexota bacterium]|jgi:NADPH:quinone reductase-like Zn-dependent oxidoreductase|nr:hypothetical protein [Chloroflexota bacterium]